MGTFFSFFSNLVSPEILEEELINLRSWEPQGAVLV